MELKDAENGIFHEKPIFRELQRNFVISNPQMLAARKQGTLVLANKHHPMVVGHPDTEFGASENHILLDIAI